MISENRKSRMKEEQLSLYMWKNFNNKVSRLAKNMNEIGCSRHDRKRSEA
jgi:hypothetical protein